jgi:hypothetical protein
MRPRIEKYSTTLAELFAIAAWALLPHCGGGSEGNKGPGLLDGQASEAASSDDGEPARADAEADATLDATADASLDSGVDANGALDAAADAAAASTDASLEGGGDAGQEAGLIACDVDAQPDARTCTGPTTVACCGGFCANTALDPNNCGHCGVACTTHQFCTGIQCDDAIVANVCGNPAATVVLDQYPADNEGGAAIGAALVANCVPATTVVQANQDDGGVVDPATGRPITGCGNTFVTGGGGFGQRGISYLDVSGISPLYPQVNGNEYDIVERATGTNALSTTVTVLTAQHDYFYVQLAVEPQSGTLCFSGVGLEGPGTLAAGYYLSTEIIPHRASYLDSWYIYEWTDTNGDSVANQGDTFMQLASGT